MRVNTHSGEVSYRNNTKKTEFGDGDYTGGYQLNYKLSMA